MPYTNAPAPTTATWSNTAPEGLTEYDENTVMYDQANVLYDGTFPWTDAATPTTRTWTNAPAPTTP